MEELTMEEFELQQKEDLDYYLKDQINYNMLRSVNKSFFQTPFNVYRNINDSLVFLNSVYIDYKYFVENMDIFIDIKNHFTLCPDNIKYIDSIIFNSKIILSDLGERSLDLMMHSSPRL